MFKVELNTIALTHYIKLKAMSGATDKSFQLLYIGMFLWRNIFKIDIIHACVRHMTFNNFWPRITEVRVYKPNMCHFVQLRGITLEP